MKFMTVLLTLTLNLPVRTQTIPEEAQTAMTMVHVTNTFQFVVPASLERAAPLFGPDGERCWAGPDWNPVFLHPVPGKDTEGVVFTVQRGEHRSVWVNTIFDLAAGRMQYVAFLPERLVSIVDVRLKALDASTTRAEVTYARTALDSSIHAEVEAMGKKDRESGPEWQREIVKCLQSSSSPSR